MVKELLTVYGEECCCCEYSVPFLNSKQQRSGGSLTITIVPRNLTRKASSIVESSRRHGSGGDLFLRNLELCSSDEAPCAFFVKNWNLLKCGA